MTVAPRPTQTPTFSPEIIANAILSRAFARNSAMTAMKLQRVLYFVEARWQRLHGAPLTHASFEAWDYGPVVRSVYEQFKSYGGEPIRGYAKDARGEAHTVDEYAYPGLAAILDRVWEQTEHRSAVELSRITHLPESGWWRAFVSSARLLSEHDIRRDTSFYPALGIPAH